MEVFAAELFGHLILFIELLKILICLFNILIVSCYNTYSFQFSKETVF